MGPALKILVVDGHVAFAENIAEILAARACDARLAHTGEEALVALQRERFDGLLVDLHLPDTNGLAILERAQRVGGGTPVIVITAYMDPATTERAEELGVLEVLSKPVNLGRLFARLGEIRRARAKAAPSSRDGAGARVSAPGPVAPPVAPRRL